MKDKYSPAAVVFYVIGALLAVWMAMLIAPYTMEGLPKLLEGFSEAFRRPFHFVWTEKSLQTVMIIIVLYSIGIGIFLANDRNYRRREEHGSAKWGNPYRINRKYAAPKLERNKVLTQHCLRSFRTMILPSTSLSAFCIRSSFSGCIRWRMRSTVGGFRCMCIF